MKINSLSQNHYIFSSIFKILMGCSRMYEKMASDHPLVHGSLTICSHKTRPFSPNISSYSIKSSRTRKPHQNPETKSKSRDESRKIRLTHDEKSRLTKWGRAMRRKEALNERQTKLLEEGMKNGAIGGGRGGG